MTSPFLAYEKCPNLKNFFLSVEPQKNIAKRMIRERDVSYNLNERFGKVNLVDPQIRKKSKICNVKTNHVIQNDNSSITVCLCVLSADKQNIKLPGFILPHLRFCT